MFDLLSYNLSYKSMNTELYGFKNTFLKEDFLDELRKESLSRSLPSKSVLDALKHSTSLNKLYEVTSHIQSLDPNFNSLNPIRFSNSIKLFLERPPF